MNFAHMAHCISHLSSIAKNKTLILFYDADIDK